jgi:hypothetical protein
MTDSDTRAGTWLPIPGAGYYDACDRGGLVRSRRTDPPRLLTPKRTGTSRYWQVKYTDDQKVVRMRPVHQLVLEAHVGPCPEGMQGCHRDDDPDNNDLANLRWDYPPANLADRRRNHPAKGKPPKVCGRCGTQHNRAGRNCLDCLQDLGCRAALRLVKGDRLETIADDLEYPNPAVLFELARSHGGLWLLLFDEHPGIRDAEQPKRGWLRRVINRWEASRQNSDAP